MLLELWSAEALGLKQGVVGGLMPVRCREVGQRLPESLMSGFMMRTQQEEPRESCLVSQCVSLSSPRMVSSEPNLHVLFPQLSQMWQRLGKRERRLCTPWGGTQWDGTTFLLPNGKTLPPSERHLLTRWGGTAGVVNQAATVQGPATSQHQGLTLTPHISSVHLCQFTQFTPFMPDEMLLNLYIPSASCPLKVWVRKT